jgi:hypothetical protein
VVRKTWAGQATSFFREVITHFRAGKQPQLAAQIDPVYRSILKQSQCAAQGNFEFTQIPNGRWFVLTEVTWAVGYARQGGTLMREVSLANGETVQVLLTDKDFIGR